MDIGFEAPFDGHLATTAQPAKYIRTKENPQVGGSLLLKRP